MPDPDAYCLALLREVAELAMAVVRATQANVMAQVQAASMGGLPAPESNVAAFDRAARCVRRTVRMIQHVAHPRPQQASTSQPDAAQRRAAARRQVLRAVQDGIGREADTDVQAERLGAEALERLDGLDLERDIAAGRPLAELAGEVLRDLGLGSQLGVVPAMRRTPADVAALCAWAEAAPGAPRDALPPLRPPQAWAGVALHHPDDLVEMRLLSDAQIEAGCKRQAVRERLRGSG